MSAFGAVTDDTSAIVSGLTRSNFTNPNSLVIQDDDGSVDIGHVLTRMTISAVPSDEDVDENTVNNRVYFGTRATFVAGTTITEGRAVSLKHVSSVPEKYRIFYVTNNAADEPDAEAGHPIGVSLTRAVVGQTVDVALSGFTSIWCECSSSKNPQIGGKIALDGGKATVHDLDPSSDDKSIRTIGMCVMRDETMAALVEAGTLTDYKNPILIRIEPTTQHPHADT